MGDLISTSKEGELLRFVDRLNEDVVKPAQMVFVPQKRIAERLNELFINKRIYVAEKGKIIHKPVVAKVYKAPYGFHIIVGLYPGLSLDSIMEHYTELCYALDGECKVWMDNSGWVHIKVFNKHLPPRFKYVSSIAQRIGKYPLALPIGVSRQGVEIIKLFQGEQFAVLVVGMPRWGKSAWFRQALTSVVTTYDSDRVWLYLIDLKQGVEFEKFHHLPHVKAWSGDERTASRVLTNVLKEVNTRANVFKQARVTSILEYNALKRDYIPHMILAIDEYALLSKEDKGAVHEILMKGSFAGVHPLICVQRPTADAMPGASKAMIPVVLCFKTANRDNSRWALGDKITTAAYIKEKGRAVYLNGFPRMVQVMWLGAGECEAILQERYPQPHLKVVRELVP